MKKIVFILFIISLFIICSNYKNDKYTDNIIRFRIIANSNSIEDQKNKLVIKKELEKEIFPLFLNANSKDDARRIVKSHLADVDNIVKKYDVNYQVNYGYNYFPEKEYKDVTFPKGEYESLVITLGDGIGENWWCILYPPLCLIDEDNNEEYDLFIKKIFKIFKS